MREMTIPAKVDKQGRVTIPPIVRETLSIGVGDVVEITVRKMNLTEKEESQSTNPLLAAETLEAVSA
jgi:AbrB family looped-hinge helix DNA binding protein